MKFAAVVCIVLLCGAGANAGPIDDLLNQLKPLVGQSGQDVGQLVLQTIQNFLNNGAVGKRDLKPEQLQAFIQQATQTILQHLGLSKDVILAKLKELLEHAKQISSLQWINQGKDKRQLHEDIDAAVAKAKREMSQELQTILSTLMSSLQQVAIQTLGDLGQHLVNKLAEHLATQVGKRGIIDVLQPHIDTVSGIAGNIGNALAGHANNVWNTVQGHISTLGDKLQPHIDTISGHVSNIIGHSQNGIDAIKDAVTDILNQTFQNISGNVSGIAGAGSAAVGTVVDHVTGGKK